MDIDSVRRDVLAYFHVDPSTHSVIFNAGATAGLKTVGESFCWKKNDSSGVDTGCNHSDGGKCRGAGGERRHL